MLVQMAAKLRIQQEVIQFETMKKVLEECTDFREVYLKPTDTEKTRVRVLKGLLFDGAWATRDQSATGYGTLCIPMPCADGTWRYAVLCRHLSQSKCRMCTKIVAAAAAREKAGIREECSEGRPETDPNIRFHLAEELAKQTRVSAGVLCQPRGATCGLEPQC
jgi:hypothetical protein